MLLLTPTNLEGGVEARLAAAHVVALPLRRDRLRVLAPALEEADRAEDLIRVRVDKVRWRRRSGQVR